MSVVCGSCGLELKRFEVGLCELCLSCIPVVGLEHIAPIVERVMDQIVEPRKDAA